MDEPHSCGRCRFFMYDPRNEDIWCELRHNLPGYTLTQTSIDSEHIHFRNSCRLRGSAGTT
jgi:hypothetical protein